VFDRPIAAFDIETIPDPDVGRRIFGLEGEDAVVVEQMFTVEVLSWGGDTSSTRQVSSESRPFRLSRASGPRESLLRFETRTWSCRR